MAFLIERLISLRDMVVILFVRCHVDDFIGDDRILRILVADLAIRRLDKSVLIDAGIGSQRVDQTDVRTFRSLDRAHTSVVRVVDISNLESGTVSGQTARAEGGQTSLMCQLAERVVLIHELREL